MRPRPPSNHPFIRPVFHHRIECTHQVEIELWPAVAEAYFLDERYSDPAAAQIRFDAVVYNSPSRGVRWEVQTLSGGPGLGTIDTSGLYTAPKWKADLGGTTEIVVATAADDPLRKAFARVTLLGRGPEAAPDPRLELFPRHCCLYVQETNGDGDDCNGYIDASNKRQLFRVEIFKAPAPSDSVLVWKVTLGASTTQVASGVDWYLYRAPNAISAPTLATVTVELQRVSNHAVIASDAATVLLVDYRGPNPPHWLAPVSPPSER
jgi:hypothetical protein